MPSITEPPGAGEDGAPYDAGPVPDAPEFVRRRVPNADGVTQVRLAAARNARAESGAGRVCWSSWRVRLRRTAPYELKSDPCATLATYPLRMRKSPKGSPCPRSAA